MIDKYTKKYYCGGNFPPQWQKEKWMKKILMHKNDEVALFSTTSNGIYTKLNAVAREDLLPDRTREYSLALQRWLLLRRQSSQISEFAPAKNFYGSECFTSRNMRSMLDCYWIKSEDNPDETWEDVNPFETWDPTFDSTFMAIYKPADFDGLDDSSPNLTIPGTDPLMWYEFDGFGLINENAQKDMNDYRHALSAGYDIMAEREYKIIAGRGFSYRKTNTSPDVERIPFDVLYNEIEDPSKGKGANIKLCCEHFGIPDWKHFISQMIELDKETGKKNRELADVGVLRDANTLECIAFDKL